MTFGVSSVAGGSAMWLKAVSPAVKWGPRSQAVQFGTAGEAKKALSRLGAKAAEAKVVSIDE
jgi:hypothetical protein